VNKAIIIGGRRTEYFSSADRKHSDGGRKNFQQRTEFISRAHPAEAATSTSRKTTAPISSVRGNTMPMAAM
jgi:hypothetical protein